MINGTFSHIYHDKDTRCIYVYFNARVENLVSPRQEIEGECFVILTEDQYEVMRNYFLKHEKAPEL